MLYYLLSIIYYIWGPKITSNVYRCTLDVHRCTLDMHFLPPLFCCRFLFLARLRRADGALMVRYCWCAAPGCRDVRAASGSGQPADNQRTPRGQHPHAVASRAARLRLASRSMTARGQRTAAPEGARSRPVRGGAPSPRGWQGAHEAAHRRPRGGAQSPR